MASAGGATQEPDIFEIGHVIDDNYVISARLGKGGYGEIYRATSISDGSVVAVKVERASKSGNLFEELNILNVLTSTSAFLHASNSGGYTSNGSQEPKSGGRLCLLLLLAANPALSCLYPS